MSNDRNNSKDGPGKKKYRIKVTPDGPYIITGDIPMSKQVIIADRSKRQSNPLNW